MREGGNARDTRTRDTRIIEFNTIFALDAISPDPAHCPLAMVRMVTAIDLF